MKYKLMYRTAVTKTDFNFGRMHIHVNQRRVELQLKHISRIAITVKHILDGEPDEAAVERYAQEVVDMVLNGLFLRP